MAIRWNPEGIYKERTEERPYSLFTHDVKIARGNLDKFRSQLTEMLSNKPNWKAMELDLQSRFMVMLDQYINWYAKNKEALEKFKPKCPYTFMLDIVQSTKREILKYFPKLLEPIKTKEGTEGSPTKEVILDHFESMDKLGWKYAFVSETDFNLFVEILTNFFEYKPYQTLEEPIRLKRSCKTKVAKTLGEIHKELSENHLNSDYDFLNIIRLLNHFQSISNFDLVKAMQR